jgi:hypothetical protein
MRALKVRGDFCARLQRADLRRIVPDVSRLAIIFRGCRGDVEESSQVLQLCGRKNSCN